jgi:calcineurin-like phosphoesterase family protein
VEEMNETIIENWNKTVNPGDYVYHLGDFAFGQKKLHRGFYDRLNGSIRLIVGNHDDIKFYAEQKMFKKIVMWYMMPQFRMVLTHVPIHLDPVGNHFSKI